MAKALSGFMEVMSRLNNEINGAQPSEPTVGKDDTAPRVSAYAVSEVARMLGERRT